MIIRTQSLLNYLDMMGAMPSGDPYIKSGKTFLFYNSPYNKYGHALAVDNEFYDLITVKNICNKLGIGYDEEKIKGM